MKWNKELKLAGEAALAAGDQLRRWQSNEQDVLDDRGRDIKLRADRLSEEMILVRLREESAYGVLAEESGVSGTEALDKPIWIVDPLDGTLNYGRNLPLFCVSIGLWHGNRPSIGVVYDIMHEQLFTGIVGVGAWCNEVEIHVSAVTDPDKAVIATGFPVNRDFDSEPLRQFLAFIQRFKKVRLFGSAALSLAYLAAGRVDAYAEEEIMLWDVAAGIAIVEAAGGSLFITKSKRHPWARKVVCASTTSLRRNGFGIE